MPVDPSGVSALLRCPTCGRDLERADRTWRCAAGHAFDIARQGYVNLTVGRTVHTGDTPAMLDARAAVLDAGHLDVVTEGVADALGGDLPTGALVEVGAGTAHHLLGVRRRVGARAAVALDASVAAAKRAARAAPEDLLAVVADAWGPWPLRDGVAAAVLTIFAPRNLPETARVLAPGGRLVTVTPAPDHLRELIGPLGLLGIEPGKAERLAAVVGDHLQVGALTPVRRVRTLARAEAAALAAMGPSGHHLDPAVLADRVAALPPRLDVTVAVTVMTAARPSA